MRTSIDSKNFIYIENPDDGAVYLGNEISKEIGGLRMSQVLLFVSGGSCLAVLPSISNDDFSNVTISVLDERFEKTNENNNFSQIEKNPWSREFLKKGGRFISTKILSGDTQQKLASRFQFGIEKWIENNPGGQMIALFGMGSDGHTAGIFPYPENIELFSELFDGEKIIVSYDAKQKNQFPKRITATNAIFKKLKSSFVYIYGEEKRKALSDFKLGTKKANELPIMFLKNIGKIKIVTGIK